MRGRSSGMKLALGIIVAMGAVAHAEPIHLAIVDAEARNGEPALAKSDADCMNGNTPDAVASAKTAVGKVTYTAIHTCQSTDQSGLVAIARGDTHFDMYVGTVRHQGANMTAAPMFVHVLRDAFSAGTFADRAPAVVYRVDLSDAAVCFKAGCGEESQAYEQLIIACTIPTAVTPVPRCTAAARATCVTAACAAPVFDRGVLTAGQGRARTRFVVP